MAELLTTIDQDDFEGISKGYDPLTKIHQIVRRSPWMDIGEAYKYTQGESAALATTYDGSATKIKWNGVEIDGYWRVKNSVEEDSTQRQGRIVQVARQFNTSETYDELLQIRVDASDGNSTWIEIERVWFFRDELTKITLTTKGSGAAVTDWDDSGGDTAITWRQNYTIITDNQDGSFTIRQRLVNDAYKNTHGVGISYNDARDRYWVRRPVASTDGGYETGERILHIKHYASTSGAAAATWMEADGSAEDKDLVYYKAGDTGYRRAPGDGMRLVAGGVLWEVTRILDVVNP
jgi:hypothetical protein